MTNMSPRSTTGLTCKSRQTDINYKVCAVIFCNGATVSLNIQKGVYTWNCDPEPKLCSINRIHVH